MQIINVKFQRGSTRLVAILYELVLKNATNNGFNQIYYFKSVNLKVCYSIYAACPKNCSRLYKMEVEANVAQSFYFSIFNRIHIGILRLRNETSRKQMMIS